MPESVPSPEPVAPPTRTASLVVGSGRIHVRALGSGPPIVVLHGGPDFDHRYLLPDIDRLADAYRVVLYDQRGRGGSYTGERPKDITIASELDDLDAVRTWAGAERVALLGHSFGAVLAVEYTLRHPECVSHLVLLSPAPISRAGLDRFREHLAAVRTPAELQRMAAIRSGGGWATGDIETDLAWYRLHFRPAFHRPEDLERLLPRLRDGWTPEQVVVARAIEDRLYAQTWQQDGYDRVRNVASLVAPTLVFHGDHDLVPSSIGAEIAATIPGARLVILPACGHFAYLEQPAAFRAALDAFLVEARR